MNNRLVERYIPERCAIRVGTGQRKTVNEYPVARAEQNDTLVLIAIGT